MSFLDLLKHRRSIRQYKEEAVSKEALEAIVEAGLLSPSGRNIRPWELIVVQKKETLEKMSECRVGSAKMLAGASVAIVVIADPEKTDVWTEDGSIVMSNMHNGRISKRYFRLSKGILSGGGLIDRCTGSASGRP